MLASQTHIHTSAKTKSIQHKEYHKDNKCCFIKAKNIENLAYHKNLV